MISSEIDTELHKNIVDELAFDPSVDERDIAIAVGGHVVTLTGRVRSFAQKLAAEKAVKRVSGVRGIVEELTIELPVFHRRNDADIASSALDAMRWNASVPADSVVVKVEGGWITLSGTVEWQYQREAARLAVASIAGVLGVSNDIILQEHAVAGDVKAKIQASFRRHAEIDANRIDVEVADGTVTLRGPVHSWTEREDAATAAYSIPGVWDVKNQTSVS